MYILRAGPLPLTFFFPPLWWYFQGAVFPVIWKECVLGRGAFGGEEIEDISLFFAFCHPFLPISNEILCIGYSAVL